MLSLKAFVMECFYVPDIFVILCIVLVHTENAENPNF